MLVIGLTGGIGSGKTTVTELFAAHAVPIIDADLLAREQTEPGSQAWKKICAHFGNAILKPDGSLDRKKLRSLIFDEPEQRHWLEQLLHPLITEEIQKQVEALKEHYCIVVLPLLLETGPYPFIDRILVVEAPEETRIERLKARDQAEAYELKKIIKTQISSEQRLKAAHEVIHNTGKLDELKAKVAELHEFYLSLK